MPSIESINPVVTPAKVPLITPGDLSALNEILMELRQLNFFIKQLPLYLNTGAVIKDEDADYRLSLTSSDINNTST